MSKNDRTSMRLYVILGIMARNSSLVNAFRVITGLARLLYFTRPKLMRSVTLRVLEGTELPFQTLALNSGLSEALSKIVLGSVSSSVAAVTYDWNGHLLILLVVGEDFFESLAQSVEVTVTNRTSFKHAGLNLGHCEVACVDAVGALPLGATVL